jgi:hypothetical protein
MTSLARVLALVSVGLVGCAQLDELFETDAGENFDDSEITPRPGETTGSGEGSGSGSGEDEVVTPVDPILHYKLDGSLANGGSLVGFDATGAAITYVPGVDGNAVAFDTTSNTHVLLPTQGVLAGLRTVTIGFWFREDAIWDGPLTTYLFDNRGAGGFQSYHGYAGAQALTTCSDAGCQGLGYLVGTWHHLAYRYDGEGDRKLWIYIDGKPMTSLPASDVYFAESQTSIVLGTRTNVQIDDVQIFDVALTQGQLCTQLVGGTWTGTTCTRP